MYICRLWYVHVHVCVAKYSVTCGYSDKGVRVVIRVLYAYCQSYSDIRGYSDKGGGGGKGGNPRTVRVQSYSDLRDTLGGGVRVVIRVLSE